MTEFSENNQPTEGARKQGQGRRRLMTDAIMLALNREADSIVDGKPTKRLSVIVEQLVKKAEGGDLAAIKEVIDRVDGKAIQALEHTGKDGGPIVVTRKEVEDEIAGLFDQPAPDAPGSDPVVH